MPPHPLLFGSGVRCPGYYTCTTVTSTTLIYMVVPGIALGLVVAVLMTVNSNSAEASSADSLIKTCL